MINLLALAVVAYASTQSAKCLAQGTRSKYRKRYHDKTFTISSSTHAGKHHFKQKKLKGKLTIKRSIKGIQTIFQSREQQRLQVELDPKLRQQNDQAQLATQRRMRLSLGALGITLTGSIFPIFTLPAVAAVIYLSWASFHLVWKDFRRGHILSFYLVGAIVNLSLILTGQLILAALSSVVYSFFARLTNQLENNAQNRLLNVFDNHPERVWIVNEGVEVEVNYHTIEVGNKVIVSAGEIIPVDGRVTEGLGQVDQHILTGESQPAEKAVNDSVFASTLLVSGRLIIEVTTAGNETVTAKITQALNRTQDYKDRLIIRGRKLSDRFIPVKLGIATLTLPILGGSAALAVLPANLGGGLSITGPMSVLTYLQLLARQNILVKDGNVFDSLHKVDTIVFDKTGTLTDEQPTLGQIHSVNGFGEQEVITVAAAAEARQVHPIARAILAYAELKNFAIPDIEEASYEVGYGIKVRIKERWVRVGSARFLEHEGIPLPQSITEIQVQAEAESHSLIYVAVNDQLAGILEMCPTLRPEAKSIIQALKQQGYELFIISGDHPTPTRRLADMLGIDRYCAEILPEHKAEMVQQLRDEGRFVCFIGDGINDAIALKTAQVSISLKGASTAATDTAQIVFMDGTLQHLPLLFDLVEEFETTLQRAVIIGFAPGIFTIAGVFLWHFSVATSLAILYVNILAGTTNFVWPIIKYLDEEQEEELFEQQLDSHSKPTSEGK